MYQRILSDPLLFPQDMPHDAMTLITGLLQRDPTKRLGANGAEEIKRHPFFAKYIDWNRCVPLPLFSYSSATNAVFTKIVGQGLRADIQTSRRVCVGCGQL